MDKQIDISIIVPVYNVEMYLEQCVRSLIGQSHTNIEIILVDDGSPDKCPEICDGFSLSDTRVRVVHKQNGGLSSARNAGLDIAMGEYVLFVDSDDWIHLDLCYKLLHISQNTNADMVICAIQNYDDITGEYQAENWCSTLPFPKKMELKPFSYKDINPNDAVSEDAPVTAWNKLYKRSFIEENNLRFPEGLWYEDNPFFYEALVYAKRICFTNERLYYYRVNRKGSIQQEASSDIRMFDIVPIMRLIWDIFERNDCNKLLNALQKYMIHEFAWRYIKINFRKRRFLRIIQETFSQKIFEDLKKELISLGTPVAIFKKDLINIPQVSVIIPTYNNEQTIKESVDSALSQTLKDIEVIIVNDCSTDRTLEILNTMAKLDNRIMLLSNDNNSGPGFSRTRALAHANGEYIFFLDGDDLLASSEALMLLYTACEQNNIHTSGGNIFVQYGNKETEVFNGHYFNESCRMNYSQYSTLPTWGFSRFLYSYDLITAMDIEFPVSRYYEDPVFLTRYMSVAREFWVIPQPVYLYRQSFIVKTLNIKQYRDLFPNILEVLMNLKAISWQMYYNEYNTFLTFCRGSIDFMEANNNDINEISALADKVFSSIDFSNSRSYIGKSEIYYNFIEFAKKNGMSITENSSGILVDYEINKKAQNTFMKRLLTKLLRPIFGIFRKAILKAISPVLNELRVNMSSEVFHAIWKAQAEITSYLQENTVDLIERSQEYTARLISNTQADIADLIVVAQTDIARLIGETQSDTVKLMVKTQADTVSLIEKAQMDSLRLNFLSMIQNNTKRVFLIGTPGYGNIGDAAITLGTYAFIRKYFKEYSLYEITGYQMEQLYPQIQTTIGEGDIVMLQGGGNLGDMYMDEENIRRKVISDFPNNRIVILPQTIYFSDTESGRHELAVSKDLYNCHKNLVIFLRGNDSLYFAKEHFSNTDSYLAIDMVHMLNYRFGLARKGVLLCIRDLEEESGLDSESYKAVFDIASKFDDHRIISHQRKQPDNLYSVDISEMERGFYVLELLKQYASSEVAITDRLHGMIFSIITGTPCVILSAQTQKIREYVRIFKDSNAIFFIDKDVNNLEDAVRTALTVKEPRYPIDIATAFNDMQKIIKSSF